MGFLSRDLYFGAVTYETESAVVYFEKGNRTHYAVLSGIPRDAVHNLAAYRWRGVVDECGSVHLRNAEADAPARVRNLLVDVRLVTTDKSLAYWIEGQAETWQRQVYGVRLPQLPPPLPIP